MTEPVRREKRPTVLTIPLRDRGAFEDACEEARTGEELRAAVVHLDGSDDIGPGPAAVLAALEVPVVAALSGNVDDSALELALAADVRICAEDSTFALSGPTRGDLPSDGGTQRLPRIVGLGLATDMLMTGRRINAEEALRAGLVTEITAPESVVGRANEVASEIAAHGRAAGRFTKEAVKKGADMPLDPALHLEADLAILLHTDPERAEGIDAFKQRRSPGFRDETTGS